MDGIVRDFGSGVYEDGRVEVMFPTEHDDEPFGTPVVTTLEKWREINAHIEGLARAAGLFNPNDHDIAMPTDIIRIVQGMDNEGNPVWSTLFQKFGEDKIIDFMTGLGMLEAAKADFMHRSDFFGECQHE